MRRPKEPKEKDSNADRQPPGGRAWQRVEQFTRSRGLSTGQPPAPAEEVASEKKRRPAKQPRKDG